MHTSVGRGSDTLRACLHFLCVCLQAFLFSCVVVMVLWSYARTILTSSSVRDNPPPEDYFHKIRQMFPGQPEVGAGNTHARRATCCAVQ